MNPMQYNIKRVDDYLLILDEVGVTDRGYRYWVSGADNKEYLLEKPDFRRYGNQVLAHLPLNNAPILKGVPTLPILPVSNFNRFVHVSEVGADVEIAAYEHSQWSIRNWKGSVTNQSNIQIAFMAGNLYTKERMWTEEEVKQAIFQYSSTNWTKRFPVRTSIQFMHEERVNEIIKSFNKPKSDEELIPIAFIAKLEYLHPGNERWYSDCEPFEYKDKRVKTMFNNDQNGEVWVGEWVMKIDKQE